MSLPVGSGSQSADSLPGLGGADSSASLSRAASSASVVTSGDDQDGGALSRTNSKVDSLVPDALEKGATPTSGKRSRIRLPNIRAWRHSVSGTSSALAPKTPSQLGKDATSIAEKSEKTALKAESGAVKDNKKGKVDVVAKWKKASEALVTAKDTWQLAQDEWKSTFDKIEADRVGFQSDLDADPTSKKLSEQVRELAGKKIRAEKMAREAGEKVAAMQTKADGAGVKLEAARAAKGASAEGVEEDDVEGLELSEGYASGASRSVSEGEEEVEESGEHGDMTLEEEGVDPSLVRGPKGDPTTVVAKSDESGQANKCDSLDTAAKLTIIAGVVIAAFGALCLAGIIPQAVLGGVIGAITVTSAGALFAFLGLGTAIAILRRNNMQTDPANLI